MTTGPVRASSGSVPAGVYALGGLVLAAFVALFYRWMWKQGVLSVQLVEDWGHALAIPLISGWMVWKQREVIARTPIRVFWPGMAPMLLGMVCYLFFVVGVPNHMLQGFSIVLTVFGVALLLLGSAMMRHLFLPIAYLVFAVTLAERIMIEVTFQLKLIASYGAWVLLSATGPMIGYSVRLDGNMIEMIRFDGSIFPMNVADACSGMRMVVAFVALGAAVALLGSNRWWQRTAVLLLTVPVAVLMNVFRVAALGWLGFYNENLAGGEAHTVIGTILLLPSLLFFMLLVWALGRLVDDEPATVGKAVAKGGKATISKGKADPTGKAVAKKATSKPAKKAPAKKIVRPLGPPPPGAGTAGLWRSLRSPACLVALLALGATAAGMGAAVSYFKLYLSKLPIEAPGPRMVASIPTETENWERYGQDEAVSADVLKTLGTENYVTRRFARKGTLRTANPVVIDLHLAYYTGTIDTVPHVPERCFVGGGMEMGATAVTLRLPLDDSDWLADGSVESDPALEHLRGRVFTTKLSNEWGDSGGSRVRLPFDPRGIQIRVTQFLMPGEGEVYSGYFFIANGATTASADGVRLLAFRLEDDYAFYLKVQFTSQTTGSAEELAAQAGALMDELLGEIMRCAPDWVLVERGEYPADNPRRGRAAGVEPESETESGVSGGADPASAGVGG